MSRDVKPVNVSPLIKGARWSLLIVGLYYGIHRRAKIGVKELKERPLRLAALKEEHFQRVQDGKKRGREELKTLFKEMDFEPEPGWEEAV